ncbi:MAG: hypothetical protein HDR00_07670 [Lachnospiraceae bacterium]|nr:hypothetical protein [Lachnospiraceae bacterium]
METVMKETPDKKVKGMDYIWLALTAFGGLGLEALYAYLLEPMIYGCGMQDWKTWHTLLHWTITCITWGIVAWYTVKSAKKSCGFNLFEKSVPIKLWQWGTAIVCAVICLISTYIDWAGSKLLTEFGRLGALKFTFQYIYYLFEVIMFMLIIVFGQKAFEVWFKKTNIPYGGIVVALTWGMAHWFTKGSLTAGLYSAFGGFCFGTVYLLLNRNIKWTYAALCIMFIL